MYLRSRATLFSSFLSSVGFLRVRLFVTKGSEQQLGSGDLSGLSKFVLSSFHWTCLSSLVWLFV